MRNKNIEVICFGPIMVDVIIANLPRTPEIGEELYTNEYIFDIGGGAAITAVGLKRLRHSSSIVSCVGNDFLGKFISSSLVDHGINIDNLKKVSGLTNISVELTFKRERSTATALTTEYNFELSDIQKEYILQAKHLHLVGPISRNIFSLLQFADSCNCSVSLDFNSSLQQSKNEVEMILPFVDVLLPNLSEAMNWNNKSELEAIAIELASSLRKKGVCVIKMGDKGAIASDGENVYQSSAFRTNVKDTTGAGDSFNAGFLHGYLKNESVDKCLLYGNIMGYLKVQNLGGIAGMPDLDRFNNFLASIGST